MQFGKELKRKPLLNEKNLFLPEAKSSPEQRRQRALKREAMSFLDNYGLKNAAFELAGSGLSSFALVVTKGGRKYILKIYKKNSNIETEAQFGNYLYNNNVPVAKIIKNSRGQLVTKIGNLKGVLFDFCEGNQIKWGGLSKDFSENLAKIIAKMHSIMLNNPHNIPAKDFNACKLASLAGLSNEEIIRKAREMEKVLKKIAFSDLRRALVHSDITWQNLLVSEDRNRINAVIDFGDAHVDYIVWDLSVLITQVFITKTYGLDWPALSAFVKKYYSLCPLNRQEKNAIIPFIKMRNLNLAIEVNRSAKKNKKNIAELRSIENSVLTKLAIVSKYQERLSRIFNG